MAVALEYGEEADPARSMRGEQLWGWASMWCKLMPRQKGGVLIAWKQATSDLRPESGM